MSYASVVAVITRACAQVSGVAAGEEINCHYDYNEIDDHGKLVAPPWFLALPGSKLGIMPDTILF